MFYDLLGMLFVVSFELIDGWIKVRGRLVVRHFVARKAIQPSLGYGHQSENLVL